MDTLKLENYVASPFGLSLWSSYIRLTREFWVEDYGIKVWCCWELHGKQIGSFIGDILKIYWEMMGTTKSRKFSKPPPSSSCFEPSLMHVELSHGLFVPIFVLG